MIRLGQRLGADRFSVSNVLAHTPEMRDQVLYAGSIDVEELDPSPWSPRGLAAPDGHRRADPRAAGPGGGRSPGAHAVRPAGRRPGQRVPVRGEGERLGPLGRRDQPLPAAPPHPPQLPRLPAPHEPRIRRRQRQRPGTRWRRGTTPPTSPSASGSWPSTSPRARSATAATWPTRTSRTASAAPPRPVAAASGRRGSSSARRRVASAGKCLVAWGLAEVPSTLPERTARTITNPAALRAQALAITNWPRSTVSICQTPIASPAGLEPSCSVQTAARCVHGGHRDARVQVEGSRPYRCRRPGSRPDRPPSAPAQPGDNRDGRRCRRRRS